MKVQDGALEPSPEKALEAREHGEKALEAQEHGEKQQEGARSDVSFPGLDEPVPDDWETIEGGYCFGGLLEDCQLVVGGQGLIEFSVYV